MEPSRKVPNEQELIQNLDRIAFTLDKAYLDRLEDDTVLPFENCDQNVKISYSENIRAVLVKRWVYGKEEKIVDCFKNVLSVFSGSDDSLGLVIRRTPNNVEMYFVTQNIGEGRNEDSTNNINLLADSLRGNFSGSDIRVIDAINTETEMKKILNFGVNKSISCLCNVPSDKSDDYISQGIDKLLNGIVPKSEEDSYVILMLAQALSREKIRQILTGYEDLATALTPYSGYQFQQGQNSTETFSEMESLAHSEGISTSITKTHSFNLGLSVSAEGVGVNGGYGYSRAKGKTKNFGDVQAKGITKGLSLGTSDSTTYTYKSYVVNDLINKLEKTIERIQISQANGLWCSASYVLARDAKTSKNVANFLCSLTQGDESFTEPAFIQEWSYQNDNGITAFGEIKEYLSHFTHPVFMFENSIAITPTAYVSTVELAKLFSFPRNSVHGLPVIGCARFGREPHFDSASKPLIDIGCTYHMRTEEKRNRVNLDKSVLTSHVFITGSTGSGKSNTVYKLLHELCFKNDSNVHFLVIEPAKGEYKQVFGGKENVSVYGTNIKKAPLLKLNPFSFPEDTHVLEHIDRLVEIFNACWPMYAAMPAVLKDAIEASYVSCGWSLTHSICEPKKQFPTFETLLKKLPEIMESSAYSKDTKGDYVGALVTRVKSLTNGINGQIFCSDEELSDKQLFDENVIVDLSRVGAMETKALIMGILMIKLQEHRMAVAGETDEINSNLQHVTVLEEAHNLLRRTSSEQSQDSSNLQGKSVEMLANAIAEMRTYGEGFIIADQAPGLLDMAVIRNTNTKIIMRLPDESDRILVGKAAGLTDDQIVELSKLDTGVAAVFQNHWLEAVLCKVDIFPDTEKGEEKTPLVHDEICAAEKLQAGAPCMNFYFEKLLGKPTQTELSDEEVDRIKTWIDNLEVGRNTKKQLVSVLETETQLPVQDKGEVLYRIVNGNDFLRYAGTVADREVGMRVVDQRIMEMLEVSKLLAEEIRRQIFRFAAERINKETAQYRELLYYGDVK